MPFHHLEHFIMLLCLEASLTKSWNYSWGLTHFLFIQVTLISAFVFPQLPPKPLNIFFAVCISLSSITACILVSTTENLNSVSLRADGCSAWDRIPSPGRNLYEKVSLIHHSSPPKDVTILIVKIPWYIFFWICLLFS